MAEEQGVIIVGGDGTEHHFPPGMDPQKAAAVVREHEAAIAPKPVDEHQAGMGHDPIANAINRVLPGTGDYLEGAGQGFREGVIGGAKGFARGVVPGAIAAVKGAPRSLYDMGKGGVDAVMGGYHLFTDPTKTSHNAIDAMSGIPGKISDAVSAAATKAGADPEGFGNDVGRVTGATEVGILGARAVPLAPKPIARAVGNVMEQVGTKGAWPIRMMGAHQLGSGNPMGIVTMGMPEVLQKGGQGLQRLGAVPSSATGSVRWNPTEGANVAAAAAPEAAAAASGLSDVEIAGLKKQGYSEESIARVAANAAPKPVAPKPIRVLGKAAQDLAEGKATPAPVRGPASTLDDLAKKLGTGINEDAAVQDHQLQVENASRLANRNGRVPMQDALPASKSRGPMSNTPGLTRSDLEAVGMNPNMNYKDMTPDLVDKIKAARTARHGTHYANAQTDKSLRSILEDSLLFQNSDRLK